MPSAEIDDLGPKLPPAEADSGRLSAQDLNALVEVFETLIRWDQRYSKAPVLPRGEPELDTSEPAKARDDHEQ